MGSGASASMLEGRVLIYSEGRQKLLQTDNYSYLELRNKACKLEIDPNANLLSLTNAGNPILINSEETWSNLKIAKKTGMIVIIICPDQPISAFEVTATLDQRSDKEFQLIKKNLDTLAEVISVFDMNLLDFIKSMALFNIRKCSLQNALLVLMILLSPFISEVSSKKPFIIIKKEVRDDIPSNLSALFFKWELIIEDVKDVEYLVEVTGNNLDVLIEKHLKQPSIISKGLKLNFVALRKAENKIRLVNIREKFKRFIKGFDAFNEAVKKSIDSYSDERHKIITMVTNSLRRAKVQDPYEAAHFFSRRTSSDYSYIKR